MNTFSVSAELIVTSPKIEEEIIHDKREFSADYTCGDTASICNCINSVCEQIEKYTERIKEFAKEVAIRGISCRITFGSNGKSRMQFSRSDKSIIETIELDSLNQIKDAAKIMNYFCIE